MDQKNTNTQTNMFKLLAEEAKSFSTIQNIETMVSDNLGSFHHLPIQPLYLVLKNLPPEKIAECLPRLSYEQRNVLYDIDLWNRDQVSPHHFQYWLRVFSEVKDDALKLEFVKGEQFALFLKSRLTLWTFDVEEPIYPDHDYYFLTEDHQLLVEYDEHFQEVNELLSLIRHLYSELGVENAYAHLFKIVCDGQMSLEEEEYQKKKERQRDFGFVDYYEALDINSSFVHMEQLYGFLKRKTKAQVSHDKEDLDVHIKNQSLNLSAIIPFSDQFHTAVSELQKISDSKRQDYLQFNFIRLMNSQIELDNGLRKGAMAINHIGSRVKYILLLAMDFLFSPKIMNDVWKSENGDTKSIPLFQYFDFLDLYRIGNSLLAIPKKELKKALSEHHFEGDDEQFLGRYWTEFLDNTFLELPKLEGKDGTSKSISSDFEYLEWTHRIQCLKKLLPFARQFFETFSRLKSDGKLQDFYYLNYQVDTMDFESLILTSFANHFLGTLNEPMTSKLGLTIDEYKNFAKKILSPNGEFLLTPEIYQKIQHFLKSFGMDAIEGFNNYLQYLLKNQMEGYDYEQLSYDEFKHVGGPIILNQHQQ